MDLVLLRYFLISNSNFLLEICMPTEIFFSANTEKTDDIVIHLTPIIENYQTMLNMENDDSEDDKKLSNIAINMLCVLVNHIPPKSSALSISVSIYKSSRLNCHTVFFL